MGVISGNEYIQRIDKMKIDIWYNGSQIKSKISEHDMFKGILKSQAALYDIQLNDQKTDIMTFESPISGDKVGASFLQPRSKEDLIKRRKMIQEWALSNHGMMGRSPDYMNTVLMAFASSVGLLRNQENCFPEHLIRFYEKAREEDLSFTHTFVNPQVNRSQLYFEDSVEPISAKVVEITEKGIIVKGARLLATQGGITDELLVFSTGRVFNKDEAFAFSIPSDSKGLKFLCRESFVQGDSTFNYPLSSKFEEIDCIVVFDNVLVPWERVFFYNNVQMASHFLNESSFFSFAAHQVVSRQIIKAEFILGVALSIIDAINISEYTHVQHKVCEIIDGVETMKALLFQAEEKAKPDQWGFLRPDPISLRIALHRFTNLYPRMTQILQKLGASGLVSIPTEKDFNSEIGSDLNQYLQSATKNAEERVKIFRLAWDTCMSSFATREVLYEYFFFGDPERLTSVLYDAYDKNKYKKRVMDYLSINESEDD